MTPLFPRTLDGFQFLVSSSISSVVYIFRCRPYSIHLLNLFLCSLLNLFLVVAVVSQTAILICISDISVPIQNKATGFSMLTLYLLPSLNSFISPNHFWVGSVWGLRCMICKQSLLMWIPSILSFSCFTVPSMTSSFIQHESPESRQPCLVPDLQEKTFGTSVSSTTFAARLLRDDSYYV